MIRDHANEHGIDISKIMERAGKEEKWVLNRLDSLVPPLRDKKYPPQRVHQVCEQGACSPGACHG